MKKSIFLFLLVAGLFLQPPYVAEGKQIERIEYKELISKISGYEGDVILVNFWATWCPPCRVEIPKLVQLRKEYSREDVLILGISMDERKSAVKSFLQKNKLNYPVYWGGNSVAQFFQISGVPKTVFYNKQKVNIFSHVGYLKKSRIKRIIEKHLK